MIEKKTAEFIREHRNEDVRALALQGARYKEVDMRTALTQIEGWQLAKEKLPTWAITDGILYPVRISMEQCSSEATALYKASLAAGELFADLTGGFGIDCSYIARKFKKAIYIERNSELCDIARHNFSLLGLEHIEIVNGNSEEVIASLPHCNWIYADPARRSTSGGKVVALSDCEPDITTLEELLLEKGERAMIKCSPMLDITAACRQLKHVTEVHVVATGNECKELLFILERGDEAREIVGKCVNIHNGSTDIFSFVYGKGGSIEYAGKIMKYLYEPNVAIQKAGCHSALAQRYDIEKLHPNSQLYTSERLIPDFPGRIFEVESATGYSKGEIKVLLNGIDKANLTVRNFPESVERLRKRLKIAEGGRIYLFATTLNNGSRVLVKCHKAL